MKKDLQKRKQVNEIIDILFSDSSLSRNDAEEIRFWLADDEYSDLKEEALQNKFNENYMFTNESTYAVEMWPELSSRLGISFTPSGNGKIRVNNFRFKRLGYKAAAVIAPLLMITGILTYLYTRTESTINLVNGMAEVISLPGDIETFVLPDGSIVEMLEGSEIYFSDNFIENRTLEFSGEAYFKVAKMGGSNFTVSTDDMTVTVTGTEFHLSAFKESRIAEIKIATGKVLVHAEDIGELPMETGQHLIYDKRGQNIEIKDISEAERMELMDISLDFQTSLNEILNTMGRYLDLSIEIDPRVDVGREMIIPFNGTESPDEVMGILKYMTGNSFDYRIERETIYVTCTTMK